MGLPPAVEGARLLGRRILERRAAQVDEGRDPRAADERERDRLQLVQPKRARPKPDKQREADAPQDGGDALRPVLAEERDPHREREQPEDDPANRSHWGQRREQLAIAHSDCSPISRS